MKMRKNKFVPINSKLNSLKKTKVQFSTRLSCCLGEHQSQEFFERVNITRQSGICSKNKNNSFGDKRSNSFRQTLQLNVPFVADFSDSKQFCICYPVHFFRKKFHSYDAEDNRLASIRVYFPASRMKNGNDFKISPDFKKRLHLCPYQFEFVAYSSLLTLSLEDLSLAVFRAKSSSEKFKIATSLSIPKLLISPNNSNSQTGTPMFIGTERIYSRVLKLISCSQSEAFKLNQASAINSESNLHFKKCLLKWVGLEDFLPPASRIILVRRVSSDSGDTLGASILNSPGPKIRKSRMKESERLSIRLKQTKLDHLEEYDEDSKDILFIEEPLIETEKAINLDLQDNKRPRGRPKKLLCTANVLVLNTDIANADELSPSKKIEPMNVVVEKSLQLKSESTSNSMTDSTSEEKYSVQLSSCTTPDTHKSCSPVILNGTVTTTVSSTPSILQPSIPVSNCKIIKNKRGRPRKYPLSLKAEQTVYKDQKGYIDCYRNDQISEDGSMKTRKRSNADVQNETSNKMFRSSNSSISSADGNLSKTPKMESPNNTTVVTDKICNNVHSIWRPLKHPLPAPDPIVPFIKQLSNTGLHTDRKLKSSMNQMKTQMDTLNKDISSLPQRNLSDLSTQKFNIDSISENLCKPPSVQLNVKGSTHFAPNNHMALSGVSTGKSMIKDVSLYSNNNNQYLLQNSGFTPMMVPPNMSSYSYNNGLMSPFMNNIFHSNNTSFSNCQSPIINTIASLFSPINTPNPLKMQPLSVSPSLFYDSSCRQHYPNGHFTANDIPIPSAISHNSQQSIQHQQYSQILLASKYDSLYPNISWNSDYQWKY